MKERACVADESNRRGAAGLAIQPHVVGDRRRAPQRQHAGLMVNAARHACETLDVRMRGKGRRLTGGVQFEMHRALGRVAVLRQFDLDHFDTRGVPQGGIEPRQ